MVKLNDRYGIDVQILVRDGDLDYVDHGTDLQKMMEEKDAKQWDFIYVIIDLKTGLPAEDAEMYYPTIEDAYKDFKNLKRKVRVKFVDVASYYEDFDLTESEVEYYFNTSRSLQDIIEDRYNEERVLEGLKEDVDSGGYYIEEVREIKE